MNKREQADKLLIIIKQLRGEIRPIRAVAIGQHSRQIRYKRRVLKNAKLQLKELGFKYDCNLKGVRINET